MIRILALLLAILASPLSAQTMAFETEGNGSQLPGVGASQDGATILYDWQSQIKLGLLLGEPVISARFKWQLIGGQVTLPNSGPGDRYETRRLDMLPTEAAQHVGLYEVKMRLTFRTPGGQRYDMIVDVGAPAAQGQEWSFNSPGSPDWDETFLRRGSTADFIQEDSAKTIWRNGLVLEFAEIETAALSLSDLHAWYYKNNPRAQIDAVEEAISRINTGIALTYGFETGFTAPPGPLPLATTRKGWAEAQKQLADRKAKLAKLMRVEDKWRLGANPEPYREAKKQAQLILRSAERERDSFEPQGVSMLALRGTGSPPPAFDAEEITYSIVYDYDAPSNSARRYVYENGVKLHGPYRRLVAFDARRVITGICTTRTQTNEIRDARTGEVLQTVSGGCMAGRFEDGVPTGGYQMFRPTRLFNTKCSLGLNLTPCGKNAGIEYTIDAYDANGRKERSIKRSGTTSLIMGDWD
ncbi:hypothetical protein [Tateyamaria sp. SN6-1]|uniref:hypothetical protein n=1 Tax=Tateyamaria sp. SN6-1 TaxID=3092148 RepID=UPI0039F5BDA5